MTTACDYPSITIALISTKNAIFVESIALRLDLMIALINNLLNKYLRPVLMNTFNIIYIKQLVIKA